MNMTTHHRHIGSASNPGPVSTRLGAQAKPPDGVWCGAMRRLDARMEKAPESSQARIGEERIPLRKVEIYQINSV
jgi:hypothetical protein